MYEAKVNAEVDGDKREVTIRYEVEIETRSWGIKSISAIIESVDGISTARWNITLPEINDGMLDLSDLVIDTLGKTISY